MQKIKSFCLLIFLGLTIFSCASRPRLYPNRKLKKVGMDHAQKDIDHCMQESEQFLESDKGKKMLKSGGFGALVGGTVGAVGGLFSGDIMGGAARGAAMGGAGGAVAGGLSPDELKMRYTNRCLSEKGYSVLGWN